jgi:hypothetical protein
MEVISPNFILQEFIRWWSIKGMCSQIGVGKGGKKFETPKNE